MKPHRAIPARAMSWRIPFFAVAVMLCLVSPCLAVPLQLGDIVVSDFNDNETGTRGGRIVKVDPNTGGQAVLSTGGLLVDPSGIAVVPEPSAMLLAVGAVPFILGWAARRRPRRGRPVRHAPATRHPRGARTAASHETPSLRLPA